MTMRKLLDPRSTAATSSSGGVLGCVGNKILFYFFNFYSFCYFYRLCLIEKLAKTRYWESNKDLLIKFIIEAPKVLEKKGYELRDDFPFWIRWD
jgi:hypothetical protein